MKLYATPLSHFSRKVRLLLDLYGLEYQLLDVGNVAATDHYKFGNNPLMKVPVWEDDGNTVFDSDHVAKYIVRKFDPSDRYQVFSTKLFDLNARAVMNGVMAEEVKVILAKRTKIPVEEYVFFEKSLKSIKQGLDWLNKHAEHFQSSDFTYRDLHLLCLWEHLEYYKLVPLTYEKLQQKLSALSQTGIIKQSSPLSYN